MSTWVVRRELAMVESTHPQLSVRRQCELLAVNRNRIPEEKPAKGPVEGGELVGSSSSKSKSGFS